MWVCNSCKTENKDQYIFCVHCRIKRERIADDLAITSKSKDSIIEKDGNEKPTVEIRNPSLDEIIKMEESIAKYEKDLKTIKQNLSNNTHVISIIIRSFWIISLLLISIILFINTQNSSYLLILTICGTIIALLSNLIGPLYKKFDDIEKWITEARINRLLKRRD